MRMEHHKVFASDDGQLREVEALVAGRTSVFGTSRIFRFVAAGDLPEDLRQRLRAIGAEVVPDESYEPEDIRWTDS